MGFENAMQPLALILSSLIVVGQTPATPPNDVAIVGARIVIGDGRVVEYGSIIIRDGKIASIGNGPAASANAKVIDGKGLTVYPGFIDAYSTSGLKLPDALPSGTDIPDTTTTAPATMWHANRKGIRADLKAADLLDLKGPFTERYREGVTSVVLSSGTGTLAGTAALVELGETPKVLVRDVAEEIVLRGGGFRGGEEMAGGQRRQPAADAAPTYAYPGTLFGIFGLLRQTLIDAQDYAKEDKPKTDPTYEGLRPLVTGKMPAMFTIANARDIARAGHVSDEFGFRMIVNGVPDAYRMIDVLKARQAPVIVSLDLASEPRRTPGEGDSTPTRVLEDRYQAWKERIGNARMLNAAGVPIAFRSGTSGYLSNVRKLVTQSGLSREAALRAMTIGPARIFGVSDRLGTIEVGKTANLVLMTGDFLDEKSTVKTTLVEGVPHDLKETTK